MHDKIISGHMEIGSACYSVWIIYNSDSESISHIIGPKIQPNGEFLPYCDFVNGVADSSNLIPRFSDDESIEYDAGDAEECIGCLMNEWASQLDAYAG